MKRPVIALLFCAGLIFFNSCITLKQSLNVRPDGSGSYSLMLDMGLAAALLSSPGSSIDPSVASFIQNIPAAAEKNLNGLKGIDSVSSESSQQTGRYGFSFRFCNSKALNKALYAAFGFEKKGWLPALVKLGSSRVTYANPAPILKKASEKSGKSFSVPALAAQMISICTETRLPSTVKRTSNINAKIDGNSVSHCYTLDELQQYPERDFGNKIRF